MKILVIDNDSERINTLKSLESNGHLVQVVETLSEVREFLDPSVCQLLMLGPDQTSGDSLKTFSEWQPIAQGELSSFCRGIGTPAGCVVWHRSLFLDTL